MIFRFFELKMAWRYPAYKDGHQAQKVDNILFKKNLEEHIIEGKPLRYQHSYCYRLPSHTKEMRMKHREILKYFFNNPWVTISELSRKFNVWRMYVSRLLQDYPNLKMQIVEKREKDLVWMYEDVLYDIAEITQKNIKKYKETDEKLRTNELKDLSSIAKETNERKNLIEWKPTENQSINITIN